MTTERSVSSHATFPYKLWLGGQKLSHFADRNQGFETKWLVKTDISLRGTVNQLKLEGPGLRQVELICLLLVYWSQNTIKSFLCRFHCISTLKLQYLPLPLLALQGPFLVLQPLHWFLTSSITVPIALIGVIYLTLLIFGFNLQFEFHLLCSPAESKWN